jgi:hypothetical protein
MAMMLLNAMSMNNTVGLNPKKFSSVSFVSYSGHLSLSTIFFVPMTARENPGGAGLGTVVSTAFSVRPKNPLLQIPCAIR